MTLCISLNTVDFSLILCLPFVLFVTKRGSIIFFFFFGPEMYFQTGQVFFVPEWPKGEFVSILCWLNSG
jgi:hypothetical protein